jgi:hypothetical protein
MNMTIMERARSMRLHVGFPLQFWEKVVDIVVYLINKENSSSLDGGIPYEAWTCKKVNYSFLKTFSCEAFVHIDKENKTKIEAKFKKCTFVVITLICTIHAYLASGHLRSLLCQSTAEQLFKKPLL